MRIDQSSVEIICMLLVYIACFKKIYWNFVKICVGNLLKIWLAEIVDTNLFLVFVL